MGAMLHQGLPDPAMGAVSFWRGLEQLRQLARSPAGGADALLLRDRLARLVGDSPGRKLALDQLLRNHGQTLPASRSPPPTQTPPAPLPPRVTAFAIDPDPGISAITCCRNRNDNLLRALPSWLAQPVDEIVIIDWSSDTPVADSLAGAGITDPRIRTVRVEGEPRWILSHAFNLGFRLARFDTILKLDADILLSPDFLPRNPLPKGGFIAGNWRVAAPGQEFVNGFFLTAQADLAAANGFNEFITSYGWDDDDLYARLLGHGLLRRDIGAGTVHHLDHDDAARLDTTAPCATPLQQLAATPLYLTRMNRLIAAMMPVWGAGSPASTFALDPGGTAYLRDRHPPAPLPEVRDMAARLAAREMLSWRLGLRVFDIPASAFDDLIRSLPMAEITAAHVELAIAPGAAGATMPRLLIVDLAAPPAERADLDALLGRIAALAPDRQLVLRLPPDLADTVALPTLPLALSLAGVRLVQARDIAEYADLPLLRVEMGGNARLPAPPRTHRRDRLFIEAQHGLGNRMRAMASAAAIAEDTGRELIVVWTPDHHCEARFADLFDWPGRVEENASRPSRRCDFLNYMAGEPGATKGAPLLLRPGRDIWLRSAYVAHHPASRWQTENAALRQFRPAAPVRALLRDKPARFDIGLHIRSEGAGQTPLASYDQPQNWTADAHAEILHWRKRSQPDRFVQRLTTLLADQPAASCFLATDRAETYDRMQTAFGNRIVTLPRQSFDRSVGQLQHALADMLLLSRASHLLCSNWSSFSEAAMRLADLPQRHETAGVDF